MSLLKPSFLCSIIKVTDYRYGLSYWHIVSHMMMRIHIQKVSPSLVEGSTTQKERVLKKT